MEYFTNKDISCNDGFESMPIGETLKNALKLKMMLIEFRIWYNRPMVVTSWFRTLAYNTKIGGSIKSQHCLGKAVDVKWDAEYKYASAARKAQMVTNMKTKWAAICKKYGCGGAFGLYDTFFHLDIRPGTTLVTWKL